MHIFFSVLNFQPRELVLPSTWDTDLQQTNGVHTEPIQSERIPRGLQSIWVVTCNLLLLNLNFCIRNLFIACRFCHQTCITCNYGKHLVMRQITRKICLYLRCVCVLCNVVDFKQACFHKCMYELGIRYNGNMYVYELDLQHMHASVCVCMS